tara:strand:- start:212 stop:1111 length:900 start_codon:yes stop_codon:yes gene_type:complete
MTVYDCCPFWNENDLYELRLNQHWDFVDKFIVTEAGETHTGNRKPFNFDHDRFKKYKSKIIYSKFNSFEEEINNNTYLLDNYSVHDRSAKGQNTTDWIRDHFQGNYPLKVLMEQEAQDEDIIYISSSDEILKQDAFEEAIKRFENNKTFPLISGATKQSLGMFRPAFGFILDLYVYKFNLKSEQTPVAMITEVDTIKKILPSTMRALALHTHDDIPDAGWHFSWLDDAGGKKVLQKQKNWAHSRDVLPDQKVKYTHTGVDEALERLFIDYKAEKVPLSLETHPDFLMNNLDKYKGYIYE